MNQISEVITTLLHYKVVVRDTLEYTLAKDKYEEALFNEKKRSILVELEEKTPLRSILDNSGENGQKLETLIRDWYAEVYGEESTILKLANDGLRVDHAQHLAIFKGVIPIHENVESMVQGIINDAKSKGLDVKRVAEVDLAEERLYRAVAFMTLTNEMIKLFNDYNQARREANGAETAASKFIGNDLGEIIKLIMQVRASSRLTDNAYMNVQDKVVTLVEHMTGRRDLPAGKQFPEVISETQKAIGEYVRDVEPSFRDSYGPLINELVGQARANGNRIGAGEQPAKEEPAPEEPQKVEGEPVEIDPRTGMPKA